MLAVGRTTRGSLHLPSALRGDAAMAVACAVWLIVLVAMVSPSLLAPEDPLAIHSDRVLRAPSWAHPFGTDQYGRDVLGQIVHGARISMIVGIVATAFGVALGATLGVLAGYGGGLIDTVTMRLIEVLMCFPGFLLALVFQAALGPGRVNIVIAVAVAAAPLYARLVAGTVRSLRTRTFVNASRSAGVREAVIVRRHILPFVFAPIASVATIGLGTAIVLAASLSFLGLGSDDGGVADWGQLIGAGQQYLSTSWWIVTFPGLAITLVVMTAGIIGDKIGRRIGEGRQP